MKNLAQALYKQQRPVNAIYVSSYIPRKCGIATYTKDLTSALNLLNSRALSEVLVIHRPTDNIDYPWEAKFKAVEGELSSFLAAADYVNKSHADIVSIQHEFGLYGGEAGEYIVHFAEAVEKPIVTTFHTVVDDPHDQYGLILKRLADRSAAIVVMMQDVANKLVKDYGIKRNKIVVIPHGVPDLTFSGSFLHKKKRRLDKRFVMGNINLLAANKGIEYALEALAEVVKTHPEVMYLIIGQTHPGLLDYEGEKYRNGLKRLTRNLGLTNNVRFINQYLPLRDLIDWLKTLDVYVTPYLDPQQVASGALAYAIGAGKACISTPYIYAKEVLAEDRGVLVPFRDSHALAQAIIDLCEHPEKKISIERRAYLYGRLMTWPNVAQSYLHLFRSVLAARKTAATAVATAAPTSVKDKLPS